MPFMSLDRETCKRDYVCIEECPLGLLEPDADGFPTATPGAEEACVGCGHCVVFCPNDALVIHGKVRISSMDCPPIRKNILPSAEAVEQLLRARRSIRSYKQMPVPREMLSRLIDTARYAPTGLNRQSVHWTVIENPAVTRQVAGLVADWMRQTQLFPSLIAAWDQGRDSILRGAPHLFIAHTPATAYKTDVDGVIAGVFLDLAAQAHGLGSCWAGSLTHAAANYAPLLQALSLPAGHVVQSAHMIGYPKHRPRRIPPRLPANIRWI